MHGGNARHNKDKVAMKQVGLKSTLIMTELNVSITIKRVVLVPAK